MSESVNKVIIDRDYSIPGSQSRIRFIPQCPAKIQSMVGDFLLPLRIPTCLLG